MPIDRFFGLLDCSDGHDPRIRERVHPSPADQLAAMSISRARVPEGDATSRTRGCDERRPVTLDGKILCAGSAREPGHRTGNELPSLRCRALDGHGMDFVAGASSPGPLRSVHDRRTFRPPAYQSPGWANHSSRQWAVPSWRAREWAGGGPWPAGKTLALVWHRH
jgi:hypothetical protein